MIKDFDFEPEFCSATLTGYVLMPRDLANLTLWLKKGDTGFLPGHAIADLWFLANTEAGEYRHSRGFTVKYKAGWCCWSNKALAERWGWTRVKVEELMQQFEKAGMILRHEVNQYCYPMELLDYRPNFSIKSGTEIVSDEAATEQPKSSDEAATKQRRNTEGVKREYLEGGGAPEIPSESEVEKFCGEFKDLARGIEAIPESWWRGWFGSVLKREKFAWARWRQILAQDFKSDFVNRHPKAMQTGGFEKNGEKTGGGRSPAQARFEVDRELREIRARLDSAHELNMEPDPEDENRERILEKQLEAI